MATISKSNNPMINNIASRMYSQVLMTIATYNDFIAWMEENYTEEIDNFEILKNKGENVSFKDLSNNAWNKFNA